MIAQLSGQFVHDLLEDDGVDILPEHVEQEPIAHFGLLYDHVDALLLHESKANVEQVGPHPRREHDQRPIEDHQGREEEEQQHPEPEKDVDFFIDNVQGQDTHGVVFLDLARRAELVKRAFGHPGEDVDHGVDAIFLISLGERNHFDAEGEECAIEEFIH